MADEQGRGREFNDALSEVTKQANDVFERLGATVEEMVRGGETELDVLDVIRRVDIDLDEQAFRDLRIDRVVYPLRFVPWYVWFPWRPIWCWWWHRFYPWYRCCPWWWYRCHWWVSG